MALKIKNLNLEGFIHYKITTLRLGPFVDNLCMTPPKNMDDLRQQATKFVGAKRSKKVLEKGKS